MYRKLLYILFCVLAFVAGYMSADREIDANSDALYQGENTMQKDLLLGNMGMTYEYSNRILPDFPLADSDGKNIFFSQLMGKENKLVFRISSNNCSSCIDFTVECLKSVLGIIPLILHGRDNPPVILISHWGITCSIFLFSGFLPQKIQYKSFSW